jgi:uncharacterized protein YecE (DUF72 family)
MSTGTPLIGTSGWRYEHWEGPFYPEDLKEGQYLPFYAETFASVEVNSAFYGLPSAESVHMWRQAVPGEFVFSLKASRYVTHMKKLKDPDQGLVNFLEAARPFGDQLGPLLFQLPPKWRVNVERLAAFLQALPEDGRHTFEFRDQSWLIDEVFELLERHNVAFCIYELEGFQAEKRVTADFVYIRLHGPGAAYQGDYDDATLQGWAGAVSAWLDKGLDVYCYFDNDQNGYAAKNAARLQEMLA